MAAILRKLSEKIMIQVADLGEVSYILTPILDAYTNISSYTVDDYYGVWQSAWWAQADYNLQAAQSKTNGWDVMGKMHAYFKAANYLFTGMSQTLW